MRLPRAATPGMERPHMSTASTLSTDGLSAKDSVPAWQGWMAELFAGLDTDLYGDTVFEGHLQRSQAGAVIMTRLEAARHRVIRSVQGLHSNDMDYLKIVAPWQGLAAVSQQGREASARSGSWVIYDTSQAYEVANPEWSEYLIVMLPRQSLVQRGIRLEGLMGRNVGGCSGIARVALEAMRSTYQELPSMAPDVAERAGELLIDLVHLSLQELSGRSTGLTQQEAFKDRIRAHVVAHLRDARLCIDDIAVAMHCSKRHLYNAFDHEPLTLAAWIQQLRLELCMRELRDARNAQRTITDIAFGCGFSNSAHFSRAFKAYTGMAPSDFRALR